MRVFNAYNTRLVALMSFVGALLYYQSTQTPPSTEAVVLQVNESGRLVNISLSPEELENYLVSQQLQSKENQNTEMKAESELLKSPPSPSQPPPASPPSPPPQLPSPPDPQIKLLEVDLKPKSVRSKSIAAHLPVLKPSNGSFLDTVDISGHNMKEREFLKARLNILRQRASVLSYECKIRSSLAKPGSLHLIWDTKHTPNVVWCPNYKPKYGAEQSQVYKLFPPPKDRQERDQVFNNSLRMIVVRHPFSRLIYEYQDKMQKKDPKPKELNFRELQHQIIAKYRPKGSKETSHFPTFSEFIQYITDSTEKLKTREDWIKNVRCWTPYWAQCNVCATDYNFIMKLETMQQDQKFLSTVADMTELKKLKFPEWQHLTGVSSDDLMKKYMSQITSRQAWDLYQRYLLDYILFGYTLDEELMDYTQN